MNTDTRKDDYRFIKQTVFGYGKGDCFRACICSVLGIPDDGVPNFCETTDEHDGTEYISRLRLWLDTIGYSFVELACDKPEYLDWMALCHGQLCIVAGKSPRGDFLHSAVAEVMGREIQVVHDPYPEVGSNDGSLSFSGPIERIGFLFKKNPAIDNIRLVSKGVFESADGKWFWFDAEGAVHGPVASLSSVIRRKRIYESCTSNEPGMNLIDPSKWINARSVEDDMNGHPCNCVRPWDCDCGGACSCHWTEDLDLEDTSAETTEDVMAEIKQMGIDFENAKKSFYELMETLHKGKVGHV